MNQEEWIKRNRSGGTAQKMDQEEYVFGTIKDEKFEM